MDGGTLLSLSLSLARRHARCSLPVVMVRSTSTLPPPCAKCEICVFACVHGCVCVCGIVASSLLPFLIRSFFSPSTKKWFSPSPDCGIASSLLRASGANYILCFFRRFLFVAGTKGSKTHTQKQRNKGKTVARNKENAKECLSPGPAGETGAGSSSFVLPLNTR